MSLRKYIALICLIGGISSLTLFCTSREQAQQDVISDSFPEAQAELNSLLQQIYQDAMDANTEGLAAAHLNSPKFTKFGPRNFERQTVAATNSSEASFFSAISNLKVELKDIKVDVFGDFAIATFYPHYTLTRDDQEVEGSSRQTLVFLKTEQGWKIIHEHGTPKK